MHVFALDTYIHTYIVYSAFVYMLSHYREISILGKLSHPNVIQLIEVFEDTAKEKIYMVLEYCVGGLQELLDKSKQRKFPVGQAHKYVLTHTHAHGCMFVCFEYYICLCPCKVFCCLFFMYIRTYVHIIFISEHMHIQYTYSRTSSKNTVNE